MKKIFITGGSGVLGTALQEELKDYELLCPTHEELDLKNSDKLIQFLDKHNPDLIINCAAYTNVDKCETEQITSHIINVQLPYILSIWCSNNNKKIIHISTASIFGEYGALSPDIDFVQYSPLSIYAKHKKSAEFVLCMDEVNYKIIRSSWLFGNNTGQKKFIGQIYDKLKNGETIKAVTDIEGHLILASDLAKFIRVVIDKWDNIPKILHAGSYDTASRYEIAQYISKCILLLKYNLFNTSLSGAVINNIQYTNWKIDFIFHEKLITACLNREFNLEAMRPHREFISVEKTEKTTGFIFRSWREMIDDFILLMNK